MRRRRDDRPGELGGYWLSRRGNSPAWCRTWFDSDTRQTRRVSLGADDLERAKLLLAEWVLVNAKREKAAPADVTVAEVFQRYHKHHGRTLIGAGVQRRNLHVVLETLGPVTVGELTKPRQEALVRDLREKGYATNTIKRFFGAMKAALRWSWEAGELATVPPIISIPEGAIRERIASIAELAALWDAADLPHVQMFFLLLVGTMGRPKAVLDLTRFACNVDRRLVDMNPPGRDQTKKRRPIVPMVETLVPWIETVASGPLVHHHGRAIIKANKAWRTMRAGAQASTRLKGAHQARALRSAGDRAGAWRELSRAREAAEALGEIVPYTLRHTMATEAMGRGAPVFEITAFMGHSMPNRTTGRYIKARPEYLEGVAAAIEAVFKEIGRAATRPMTPPILRVSSVSPVLVRPSAKGPIVGAGEGIRTLDPNLGKVVLYP